MRRVLSFVVPAVAALALSGCPAKPKPGECKSSADCAKQEGYGKVCVEGRCLECSADSDCAAGFTCRENKCVPRPECSSDADCPTGKRCEAERCVAAQAPAEEAAPAQPEKPAVPAGCADAASFTIRFGFDEAALSSDSQKTLQRLSGCLKEAPATSTDQPSMDSARDSVSWMFFSSSTISTVAGMTGCPYRMSRWNEIL